MVPGRFILIWSITMGLLSLNDKHSDGIGNNNSDVVENIFGFRVGRHIIFYRQVQDCEIEVIRILHEK